MTHVPEKTIKAHFWGTRGSLPVSLNAHAVRSKIIAALQRCRKQIFSNDAEITNFIDQNLPFSVLGTFGGNTSCVEIKGGEQYMICDAGTGIRDMGAAVQNQDPRSPKTFNIFVSHPHWDHIQGFPFFLPAYVPGNRINFYAFHPGIEAALVSQQDHPFFPVNLGSMKAEIRFFVLDSGKECEIGGFKVRGIKQNHPGDSYGYRFECCGKTIVYSTDAEYTHEDSLTPGHDQVDFCRDADLLVFDAQYLFSDSVDTKENWGHGSNILGVELAINAGVRRVVLFHHDPGFDDGMLETLQEDARRYAKIYSGSRSLEVDMAYDGLEIML